MFFLARTYSSDIGGLAWSFPGLFFCFAACVEDQRVFFKKGMLSNIEDIGHRHSDIEST